METMEKAMRMLRRVQSDLDMAHCEACAALGMFKAIDADKSLEADVRLAAVSLRNETLELCGKIIEAMNAAPQAATLKLETGNLNRAAGELGTANAGQRSGKPELKTSSLQPQASGLPCLRTAKSMIDDLKANKRGLVATSARYGRPICAGIH